MTRAAFAPLLRRLALAVVALGVWTLVPGSASAQVRPDLPWRTLQGERLRVHFTPDLEPLARRTLANAEWAYARLAAELPAPRGIVDIVVADNIDAANGFATPFPSNRIVVYARPPVDELALRNHADWNLVLVIHELTHIFHLDRARGPWGLAQKVFGRAAPLFPNTYAPNWLIEGIAIHYESRLTGAGRLGGTEYPAQVRALALDGVPPLDAVVATRPFYPAANVPYLLGAYLVDRTLRSDTTVQPGEVMARLLERSSRRINPWRHDASAREAAGRTFSEVYRAWRDSLDRAPASLRHPGAAEYGGTEHGGTDHADLVTEAAVGWLAGTPRFLADGRIRVVANDPRRMPALYEVDTLGRVRRVGRRNSVDADAPWTPDRSVYAEWDRTDPFSVLSDLYVGTGRWRRRLSTAARLAHPDVHPPTGRIVAVRTLPGTTELVTLADTGALPRILVPGTAERTWSEPRWSRGGRLVAAALWEAGGRTSIVVLDSAGRERQRFSPRATDRPTRLAVVSAPTWMPGDSLLLFVSDHEGRPNIYRGDVRTGAYGLAWHTATALRSPDVSADGRRIVALEARADGWHVVSRALPALAPLPAAPPARDAAALPPPPRIAADTVATVERYDGLEHARPLWWLPAIGQSDEGFLRLGLNSSGRDLVGRHSWYLNLLRDVERGETVGSAAYSYGGFGNPIVTVGWAQDWVHGGVTNSAGSPIGVIGERSQTLTLTAYVQRPRARLSTYLIAGGELETRRYQTYPRQLLQLFSDPELRDVDYEPAALLAVGLSSMQRPGLSVSVEDGVAAQLTMRYRANGGRSDVAVPEAIVTASAAKSLPLPGFARHVLAARAAFGITSDSTRSYFSVGGVSGESVELLPGVAVGDPQRTFFVRGLGPAALRGSRAATLSAEYRAPLLRIGRGVGLVPASAQKVSILAFSDAGAAWCGAALLTRTCANGVTAPEWIATAGAELVLDAALQYDVLYRLRLGVARPVRGADAPPRGATVYLTFGSTF